MTPAELARCAARKIKELGLAKWVLQQGPVVSGAYSDPSCREGSVCIRGAMFLCETGSAFKWTHGAREVVEEAIMGLDDHRVARGGTWLSRDDRVVEFNNHRHTTQQDVIEVLLAAAEHLEKVAAA